MLLTQPRNLLDDWTDNIRKFCRRDHSRRTVSGHQRAETIIKFRVNYLCLSDLRVASLCGSLVVVRLVLISFNKTTLK